MQKFISILINEYKTADELMAVTFDAMECALFLDEAKALAFAKKGSELRTFWVRTENAKTPEQYFVLYEIIED